MDVHYNIIMGIRERILKRETKKVAGRFVSEKNADRVANFIFDDKENSNDNTEKIPINDSEPENNDEPDALSKLDSWLDEQVEKAEKVEDESPDPVTDLDSMENKINDLESKKDDEK